MTSKLLYWLIAVALIIQGCGGMPANNSKGDDTLQPVKPATSTAQVLGQFPATQCIQPKYGLEYPVWGSPNSESPNYAGIAPANWDPSASYRELLIKEFNGRDIESNSQNQKSLVILPDNSGQESIWISYGDFLENRAPISGVVLRYNIVSKQFQVYGQEGNYPAPYELIAARDGTLWGMGRAPTFGPPLLFRYSYSLDKFQLMANETDFSAIGALGGILDVAEAQNGKLLMIIEKKVENGEQDTGLFSFDPLTMRLTEYTKISQMRPSRLAIAPDGKVWIMTYEDLNKARLTTFDLSTESINYYRDPPYIAEIYGDGFESEDLRSVSALSFDRSGNLWVDDRGWFDFSSGTPVWHRIVRSVIFVDTIHAGYPYWTRPYKLFESSNGQIWFTADVGIVMLDRRSGKWCWITTAQSNVAEDSQHHLWVAAFGMLYRFKLEP